MAKLSVAYGLCPLIDNNSLLGVSVDSVPDCVIVTIGKNIVIRYKFQDQKQVSSWSSKDKLTSPVVYNTSTAQYTAIFNYDQLRMWNEEDQLDKVKKYKFQEPLYCVIPDPDGYVTYVVYRSGFVTTLTQALESRKISLSCCVLKDSDNLQDHYLVSCNGVKFIALISCNNKDEASLHVVPVISESPAVQYPMERNRQHKLMLVGYTVMSKDNSCHLITLWSDGSLFSFKFLPDVSDDFPGILIQKVTSISCKHPVAITSVSNSHLAFFGADSSEEGAALILLNLQFQLIQSRLHFKLYTKPPRLWNVSSHLIVAVGNNLIAVPYHLGVEELSTLLGTHTSSVAVTETSWTDKNIAESKPIDKHAPRALGPKIKFLRQEGCSQAMILQSVLPDICKEKNIKELLWCLKTFSDIPENCVVQILNFCFGDSLVLNDSKTENSIEMPYVDKECSLTRNEKPPRTHSMFRDSEQQMELIDAILNVSVSDVCIMPCLRGVPFTTAVGLLSYLSKLLENESSVPAIRIIEWLCLVIDSHYQEYLLSRNHLVLSLLTKLSKDVSSQIECLEELKKLTTPLQKLKCGKAPVKLSVPADKKYSIETLQLY